MDKWVKMPISWIRDTNTYGLLKFSPRDAGASLAALILYIAITHKANANQKRDIRDFGKARISYSDFEDITGLSRSMISRGLKLLEKFHLITISKDCKINIYGIYNNDRAGWGKLPALHLYDNSKRTLKAFASFTLRNKNELNAVKIYLLFIAFRNENLNATRLSYDKISEYTGIPRNRIKSGLSHLVNNSLIQIDWQNESLSADPYSIEKKNPSSQYRICGIDTRRHRGTQSRMYEVEDVASLI